MLPYRQVHLDFHTSECISGIGSRFSTENFEAALREGHINSITLFHTRLLTIQKIRAIIQLTIKLNVN